MAKPVPPATAMIARVDGFELGTAQRRARGKNPKIPKALLLASGRRQAMIRAVRLSAGGGRSLRSFSNFCLPRL